MKILTHFKSGAVRSLKAWKGVLVIWLMTLFLISLLALPMKSGLKSLVGSSMITELLTDTLNVDVITDFKEGLVSLLPALTSGFLLVFFLGLLMNAFLTGGMFTILSSKNNKQSVSHFFGGGASIFWSVLIITLITSLIILFTGSIIGGIPVMIVSGFGSETPEPGAMGKAIHIIIVFMALLLPILILVADYARAWQASHDEKKPFKAIGFGFSTTFRTFLISYPLMLVLMLIQFGYGAFVMSKLLLFKPASGGGVFLLFLLSQLLFIIRLLLRAWRYGCVTSVMEDKFRLQRFLRINRYRTLCPGRIRSDIYFVRWFYIPVCGKAVIDHCLQPVP